MRRFLIIFLLSYSTFSQADSLTADQLLYRITEPGMAPYLSRVLVTTDHVRLDDGQDKAGFILYDRKKGVIYSIVPEDQTVLLIAPKQPVPEAGDRFKIDIKRSDDPKAPPIAGKQPRLIELSVNGTRCEQLMAVPALMSKALEGIGEYQRTLARQEAASSFAIPADMQNDCDLVRHVYYPDLMLKEGLAIQHWWNGRRDELTDFQEGVKIDAGLMRIPSGFEQRTMDNLTGR